MNKIIIYPYKLASESAKKLADLFNSKRVKPNGKYKYFNNHLIINWGNSNKPKWAKNNVKVLNHWNKIANSCNKLTSLKTLKEFNVRTPDFTSDIEVAKQWINDGETVFCRTKLSSHSGKGIVISKKAEELVNAPLYTRYINGKFEYRLHIFNDGINEPIIFDAAQKRRKEGFKEDNQDNKDGYLIRSHHYGYAFCRDNLNIPADVIKQSINAIKALDLNFAGVDVRYKEKENKAYILELNSSVGLEGLTLENYSNMFKNYINQQPIKSII